MIELPGDQYFVDYTVFGVFVLIVIVVFLRIWSIYAQDDEGQ